MAEFDLVLKAWTPIGNYGFVYYWDPTWREPLTGLMEIHFMHTQTGYSRQISLMDEATKYDYVQFLVPRHYKEIEEVWLRLRSNNGLV